jgi:tetratricopeptide (TPR) repeat protein
MTKPRAAIAIIFAALMFLAGPAPRAPLTQPAAAEDAEPPPLPVPPVPPRIAEGEDYEHCMEMLNNDPDGANAFADAWLATGGGDGATHCKAMAQIALGDPATGGAMLEKLAKESKAPPLARAQVFGQAIQAWLMADDPKRAYDNASLAIDLSPDDPDLLIARSVAAATMQRYLDAIDDLTRALAIDSKRADALTLRAAAWRQEQKLDRAEDDISRALSIDPDMPEALLERGILRQRRGDEKGAREDWKRAITLSPDTATADLAQQNLALLEAGPSQR